MDQGFVKDAACIRRRAAGREQAGGWWLPALVVAAGALPLLAARPAPLQDWPNHVARLHILAGLLGGDPFWTRFYRFTGFLVPDAAFDLSGAGLMRLGVRAPVAAQIFLILTYAVFVAGFCALARAARAQATLKPVFAVLLFYSNALFWGLVTYVLGAGLLMAALAAWLGLRRAPLRLLVAAAAAVALLFVHVVAAVAFAAALGGFDLHRFASSRAPLPRRLAASASWLLALAVVAGLLCALPGGAGRDLAMRFPGDGLPGAAARKLMLFGRALLGGSPVQDAASLLALAACVAALAARRGRLARGPALAAAALLAAVLVAPERLGTGSLLDTRLVLLPLAVGAACVEIRPGAFAGRFVACAVLGRILIVTAQFWGAGQVFANFAHDAAALPPASVMMMAYGTPLASLSWRQIWSPPIQSVATQVVFRDLFFPAIFANPAQQPIALRAEYHALSQPWDLTDAPHYGAAAAALAPVCAGRRFTGVYLTVLYPGAFIRRHAGAALLDARRDFLILDACRLRPG